MTPHLLPATVSGWATALFALGLVLLAAMIGRLAPTALAERASRCLEESWVAPALGVLSSLAVLWVFGSLRASPAIQDDWAYVLQAKIFASGQWVAPARPLPEFFQQMYVFVSPFLGGKYPPGHPLVLLPGVVLGLPALMPVIMAGVSGALVFSLARRLTSSAVAIITWGVWITAPAVVSWYGSYFSQVTTATLFLVGWDALLRFHRSGRGRHLVVLACVTSFLAITRPLNAVAFALPAGSIAIRLVLARRAWRPTVVALAANIAVFSILPLHNRAATGAWTLSPLVLYSRRYTPFDFPTFGYRSELATLPLPTDQDMIREYLTRLRARHTIVALPRIMGYRLSWIAKHIWGDWRLSLLPLALFGFCSLAVTARRGGATGMAGKGTGREAWVAMFTAFLCVALHAMHSHDPQWSNYYFEVFAPLAFATAFGAWRLTTVIQSAPRAGLAAVALAALLLAWPPGTMFAVAHREHALARRPFDIWREHLEALPRPAIVFVRYDFRQHDPNVSLVLNREPELDAMPVWTAYDRGTDNARLLRFAPERTPFLFDEAAGTLEPLSRDSLLTLRPECPDTQTALDGCGERGPPKSAGSASRGTLPGKRS